MRQRYQMMLQRTQFDLFRARKRHMPRTAKVLDTVRTGKAACLLKNSEQKVFVLFQ